MLIDDPRGLELLGEKGTREKRSAEIEPGAVQASVRGTDGG